MTSESLSWPTNHPDIRILEEDGVIGLGFINTISSMIYYPLFFLYI